MGVLVLCYAVGLIFGSLTVIEWLVVRLARFWLASKGRRIAR